MQHKSGLKEKEVMDQSAEGHGGPIIGRSRKVLVVGKRERLKYVCWWTNGLI